MQSQGDHPPPTTSAYLLGVLCQRVQPSDEDREGLAHPGRDAEVGRRLSLGESFGQAHLVVPGLMPSDLAEEVCEVQAAHINTPENLVLPWISSTPSPLGQHRQHFRADH